jgi:multicomponent Na+:H+ antiporter subunit B
MIASLAVQIIALVLLIGAIAAAMGAVTARALFASVMYLIVVGALAGAAVLTLGAGDAALALLLLAVGVAPTLLLGAVLLTTRTAKPRRGGAPWLSLAAGVATATALGWGASDLGLAADTFTQAETPGMLAPWIAPLVFVASAACVGLLGYGERGALGHRSGSQS